MAGSPFSQWTPMSWLAESMLTVRLGRLGQKERVIMRTTG
jgi:hypothetical protein